MPRILVPTDFSEASQAVIDHVLAYSEGLPWDILLLHVIEEGCDMLSHWADPWTALFGGPLPWEGVCRELCDEAALKISASLPFSRADRVKTILAIGRTADQILRVAEDRHADLIVMGGPRKGLLSRLLLGSVTEQVLRKASIPVIMLSGITRPSPYRTRHREVDC